MTTHVTPGDRLLTVEETLEQVLAGLSPLGSLAVDPEAALGGVLAEDLVAGVALPPWDNSAMDGYAIRSADTAGATEDVPVRLAVVGEVPAGRAANIVVGRGEAVRIATGAPVPDGADAVVPVERTTPLAADGAAGPRGRDAAGPLPAAVLVHVTVAPGGSIREAGSDVRAGARIAGAGDVVTPAVVALAAGSGVPTVRIHRRPVVAVLATGDEVRAPGEALGPAGIPDANGPGLRSLVRAAGADALDLGIARDELEDVRARLRRGVEQADAVIVSGGVSVGPYDVVKLAFDEIGRMDLWRVAVQPGKPFAFGHAERPAPAPGEQAGGVLPPVLPPVLLFGLPGNPVSSFVTFDLFVRPALRRLAGHRVLDRPADRGVMLQAASKSAGRRGYIRVVAERAADGRIARDERGRVRVSLAGGQGSHVLSALVAADALAVIPESVAGVGPGDEVELRWLDR